MRKPKMNKMTIVAVGVVADSVAVAAGKDSAIQTSSRLSASIDQVKFQKKMVQKNSQNGSVLVADGYSKRDQKGLGGPTPILPS